MFASRRVVERWLQVFVRMLANLGNSVSQRASGEYTQFQRSMLSISELSNLFNPSIETTHYITKLLLDLDVNCEEVGSTKQSHEQPNFVYSAQRYCMYNCLVVRSRYCWPLP